MKELIKILDTTNKEMLDLFSIFFVIENLKNKKPEKSSIKQS